MKFSFDELSEFLNQKYNQYNQPSFIESDPIQVPHRYSDKNDIEISAFLTSSIAWGNRKIIIKNAKRIMELIDDSPYDFINNATISDIRRVENFKHRTINDIDLIFFIRSLQNIYQNHGGLRTVFCSDFIDVRTALIRFRQKFFSIDFPSRSARHIPDVERNSAAKRLNLFLMWLVRNDGRGVHLGIWDTIPASSLKLPLDVHTANVGRKLGLLNRKLNDWKAVEEITENLAKFDKDDPVKYDFALFGLGVFEKF